VVEGSVLRAGDSVRVAIQLIDGRTDQHLWSETYLRDLHDVLRLYGELASDVADRIRIVVTPTERARLTGARQVDPDVYFLVLKGQNDCQLWTREGYRLGILALRQAIDRDPTYAPAYAQLGLCYSDRTLMGFAPPLESNLEAKAAIRRALELDSTLGEAYGTRGWLQFVADRDAVAPDSDYQRALKLSPGRAGIHRDYADYLALVGRFDDAVAQKRQAIDLDPLSVNTSLGLGYTYYVARRYDEAIAQLQRTLTLQPGDWAAHMQLSWNYLQKGMSEAAVAHCDSAVAGTRQDGVRGGCVFVYGRTGRTQKAMAVLRDLLRESRRGKLFDPMDVATAYLGLGDWEGALVWLRKGAGEHWQSLMFLKTDPMWDPFRSDLRFKALLKEFGIPS
jgi:tetratricopeptide (TPR) repeat protein